MLSVLNVTPENEIIQGTLETEAETVDNDQEEPTGRVEWIFLSTRVPLIEDFLDETNNDDNDAVPNESSTVLRADSVYVVPANEVEVSVEVHGIIEKKIFPCTRRSLLVVAATLIFATVGALTLVFGSRPETRSSTRSPANSSRSHSLSTNPFHTPSPSEAPSTMFSQYPTYQSLESRREELVSATLFEVSGSSIRDPSSNQNKALRWILDDDQMNLAHNSTNFVQRYGLMLLYFSLSGDEWDNSNNYCSITHECEWAGTRCNRNKLIESLNLSENKLRGMLPSEIGTLFPALTVVDFSNNCVRGAVSALFKMKELITINMENNLLSGVITSEIGNLSSLRRMNINNNRLSGLIPTNIGQNVRLFELRLGDNSLTGSIPSELGYLRRLEYFVFYHNSLTNSLPRNLPYDSFVEFIAMENDLSGSIPSELLNGQNIQFIDLAENQLTGSVPEITNGDSALVELSLYTNMLHGDIPTSLVRLKSLERLYLAKNNMDGSTIPTFIGEMKSLFALRLCCMGLVGTVPTEVGALSSLQTLVLDGNRLTGILPSEVCGLSISTLEVDCVAYGSEDEFCSCCDECSPS